MDGHLPDERPGGGDADTPPDSSPEGAGGPSAPSHRRRHVVAPPTPGDPAVGGGDPGSPTSGEPGKDLRSAPSDDRDAAGTVPVPPAPVLSERGPGDAEAPGGPDAGDADDDPGSETTIVLGGAGAGSRPPTPAPRLSPDAVAASTTSRPSEAAVIARITPPFGIGRVGAPESGEPGPRHLRSGVGPTITDLRRPQVLLAAAPLLIVVLLVLGWAIDSAALSGQVMRNVEVAGRPVGGLGEASLPEVMAEIADDVADREVRIVSGDQTFETTAGAIGLTLDEEATAEAALDVGRSDSIVTRPFRWLGSFFGSRDVEVRYTVSEGAAALTLAQLQGGNAFAPTEPTIRLDEATGEFVATPGANGVGIDVQQVAAELPEAAAKSDDGPIVIRADITDVSPQITDEAAAELAAKANAMTANGLTLTVDGTDVHVEPAQLRTWIGPAPADRGLELAPNGEKIAQDLPGVFSELPGEPVNATVTLGAGGRPEVVPARNGVRCCKRNSAERIWNALDKGEPEVTLEAQVAEPEISTEEAQQWQITEPVGGSRAWRDGSEAAGPAPGFTTYHAPGEARVTNIHRMADLVRGAVIPPDGTFSINDHVGQRTTAKGFVPAGAISQGRHVEEVGGGVSQFATTTFNAAYFAGLDIVEYQAHSEYFSRYPRGREATMGYPAPDLKIHNNTPYGILIWTSYTDTSLTVTMYSTPYATADQTGITESAAGPGCTRVVTTRTRSFPNGSTDTDTFQATYRNQSGFDCNNNPIPPAPEEGQG